MGSIHVLPLIAEPASTPEALIGGAGTGGCPLAKRL